VKQPPANAFARYHEQYVKKAVLERPPDLLGLIPAVRRVVNKLQRKTPGKNQRQRDMVLTALEAAERLGQKAPTPGVTIHLENILSGLEELPTLA